MRVGIGIGVKFGFGIGLELRVGFGFGIGIGIGFGSELRVGIGYHLTGGKDRLDGVHIPQLHAHQEINYVDAYIIKGLMITPLGRL